MNKLFKSQRFRGLSRLSLARRVQGFTLLELLVVIVIIGMLASYVGPKYFAQIGKSEVTVAKALAMATASMPSSYPDGSKTESNPRASAVRTMSAQCAHEERRLSFTTPNCS